MRVKIRTFSGVVCEQEIFSVSDRVKKAADAPKRLRFRDEEERARHRLEMSRRNFVRLVNANCDPSWLYSTLTFDNRNEAHTFPEVIRIVTLYLRRLKYIHPAMKVFWVTGRGEHTDRIHVHMISLGVPEEVIKGQWIYGEIKECERLREHNYYEKVDRGQDYTGLANYLFDHWTPEQGGHRWRQTRNMRKPEREEPSEIKREYSPDKPPIPPKGYKLVEAKTTRYGYQYYKYVLDVEKTGFDEEISGQRVFAGWKTKRKRL